jgi:hypothetical protein
MLQLPDNVHGFGVRLVLKNGTRPGRCSFTMAQYGRASCSCCICSQAIHMLLCPQPASPVLLLPAGWHDPVQPWAHIWLHR